MRCALLVLGAAVPDAAPNGTWAADFSAGLQQVQARAAQQLSALAADGQLESAESKASLLQESVQSGKNGQKEATETAKTGNELDADMTWTDGHVGLSSRLASLEQHAKDELANLGAGGADDSATRDLAQRFHAAASGHSLELAPGAPDGDSWSHHFDENLKKLNAGTEAELGALEPSSFLEEMERTDADPTSYLERWSHRLRHKATPSRAELEMEAADRKMEAKLFRELSGVHVPSALKRTMQKQHERAADLLDDFKYQNERLRGEDGESSFLEKAAAGSQTSVTEALTSLRDWKPNFGAVDAKVKAMQDKMEDQLEETTRQLDTRGSGRPRSAVSSLLALDEKLAALENKTAALGLGSGHPDEQQMASVLTEQMDVAGSLPPWAAASLLQRSPLAPDDRKLADLAARLKERGGDMRSAMESLRSEQAAEFAHKDDIAPASLLQEGPDKLMEAVRKREHHKLAEVRAALGLPSASLSLLQEDPEEATEAARKREATAQLETELAEGRTRAELPKELAVTNYSDDDLNGPVADDSDLYQKDDELQRRWNKLARASKAANERAAAAEIVPSKLDLQKDEEEADKDLEEAAPSSFVQQEEVLEEDEIERGGSALLAMGQANFALTDTQLKRLAVNSDKSFRAIREGAKVPGPAVPSSFLEDGGQLHRTARALTLAEVEPADVGDTVQQLEATTQLALARLPHTRPPARPASAGPTGEGLPIVPPRDASPSSLAQTKTQVGEGILAAPTSQSTDRQYLDLAARYKQQGAELRTQSADLQQHLQEEMAALAQPPSSFLETPESDLREVENRKVTDKQDDEATEFFADTQEDAAGLDAAEDKQKAARAKKKDTEADAKEAAEDKQEAAAEKQEDAEEAEYEREKAALQAKVHEDQDDLQEENKAASALLHAAGPSVHEPRMPSRSARRPAFLEERPGGAGFDTYFQALDSQAGAALKDADSILGRPTPASLLQTHLREQAGRRASADPLADAQSAVDKAVDGLRAGRLALARERLPVVGAPFAALEKQMRADDLK